MTRLLEPMIRTVFLLVFSSLGGVLASTSIGCSVFLFVYQPAPRESASCALPLLWLFGFPVASVLSLVLGFPAALIFRKLGYTSWWQFGLVGTLIAVPFWAAYFWPFNHGHWYATWFYNSFQFFGAGALGGLLFWWFAIRAVGRSNNAMHRPDPGV
jgi:hypothetical protein